MLSTSKITWCSCNLPVLWTETRPRWGGQEARNGEGLPPFFLVLKKPLATLNMSLWLQTHVPMSRKQLPVANLHFGNATIAEVIYACFSVEDIRSCLWFTRKLTAQDPMRRCRTHTSRRCEVPDLSSREEPRCRGYSGWIFPLTSRHFIYLGNTR